ncbi:endonuclease VII domain-containing protein [Williamsia muralis]|uniref:endonuclease VII domain-containing protein n=1 Tax=Williamsia marianensis TaxID=85044 RepID=UPI003F17162A
MTTKTCTRCGQTLPVDRFGKSGKYLRSDCKDCANERTRQYAQENKARRNERLQEWRRANPDAARAKDLRARYMRKYGLTPDDVAAMKAAQDGRCLICGVEGELFVDHCHTTGRVRGALCPSCNTFLGRVEANPVILERMRDYAAGHLTSPWLANSNNTSA